MKKAFLSAASVVAALALPGSPAMAQTNEITIGITVTTTGPAAALGIPERNSLDFVPKEIGGVPIKLIVLDDGGDPTAATTNARRFVTESKADIIMGSSTTPPTVAVSTVANEAGIPHFGLAPLPINEARAKWSVVMPQPIPIVGKVLYEHMKAHGIKTVGFIGSRRFLWRPLGQRLQGTGRSDGPDHDHRGALCPSGHFGRRPGSEAGRRQPRRDPGRRLRHRRGAAADHAARARLQGPDLPDPRRRQHGLHPHRGCGGGGRDHGVGSGDVAGNPARQRADQEAGPGAQHRL